MSVEEKDGKPRYLIVTWRHYVRYEELGNWDDVQLAARLWWAGEHAIEYVQDLVYDRTLDESVWQGLVEAEE